MIAALVAENPSIIIKELSTVMDLLYGSVQKILHNNLVLRQHCSTWVPHHLTTEQLVTRVESYQEWLECFADQPNFFNNVVIYNESWVYHFDPLSKQQSSWWQTVKAFH